MVPNPALQRGKVAQHWCPTHELIDIPVTSLSVGRWPNTGAQPPSMWAMWPKKGALPCPSSFSLPIPSPVDKCLTISPPHNIGVCWQVA